MPGNPPVIGQPRSSHRHRTRKRYIVMSTVLSKRQQKRAQRRERDLAIFALKKAQKRQRRAGAGAVWTMPSWLQRAGASSAASGDVRRRHRLDWSGVRSGELYCPFRTC